MVLRHCDGNFVTPHFNLVFRSAGSKHNTCIYAVDFELKCKNGTVRKEFVVQGAEWIRQPQGCDLIRKTMRLASVSIRTNGADRGNSWAEDDLFTENEKQVLQANTDSLNEKSGSWSRES